MQHLHQMLATAREDITPRFRHALDSINDTAGHLGDLTKEEIDTVRDYIIRDLHDAARYLEDNGTEFKDWMNLEANLVEDLVIDWMPLLVDETRLVLDDFKHRADELGEWHTGEVVAPGTFQCKQCGHALELHKIGHIPPCAACKATVFKRIQA